MSSPPSLDGVRLKLKSAEADIGAIKAALQAYDAQRTFEVLKESTPDGGVLLRLRVLVQPDPMWAVTFGQAAYQMRSALEQIVAQLFALQGGDPHDHDGAFPISTSAQAYWGTAKDRRRGKKSYRERCLGAIDERYRRIIDDLQPYHLGAARAAHHSLEVLRNASNGDKHRIGYPATFVLRSIAATEIDHATETARIYSRNYGEPDDPWESRGLVVSDGGVVAQIGGSPESDMLNLPVGVRADELAVRTGVTFGPARIFANELGLILGHIRTEVVPRFEPLFG